GVAIGDECLFFLRRGLGEQFVLAQDASGGDRPCCEHVNPVENSVPSCQASEHPRIEPCRTAAQERCTGFRSESLDSGELIALSPAAKCEIHRQRRISTGDKMQASASAGIN